MPIYFNIKKGLSSALPSTKKEGTVYFTTDNGKLYIDISNSARVAINAVKADQAGTLNSLRPTLSIGNENNAITVQTMDNGELASLISNNFSAIRAGIDFPWYNTHWRIGNLRGGSTDSGGFGFAYSADGTTWTSCSYIKPDGTYMGTANYANSAGSVAWSNITGKPTTFTPSSHNHDASHITSGTLPIARGGTNATSRLGAISNMGIFGLYNRDDIGTSPNFDNPMAGGYAVNGLFELRTKAETSGETGQKPFDGFAPFISLKYTNTMFQLVGQNSNGFYIRGKQAANVTLSNVAWQKLLTDANYTDYTVTKTGSGASGTWGISVTGNAATCGGTALEWDGQVAWADTSWIAAWTGDGKRIKALNKNSFAPASHSHSYLPLAGGTLSGDINFQTIATWPTVSGETYPINSAGLYWNGSSDTAKIFYRVTASDSGHLIIQMGDATDETVVVENNSGTVYAKIGNGGVTANNFYGTATKATSIQDSGDGRTLYVNYSASAMTSCSWLAAWNGNTLQSIAPSSLSVNYASTAGSFNSSRTIALTGAVTGSISSNGASGWSIDTVIKNHGISPTNFTSTFRTQTKGDSNSGSYFAVIRNDNTDSWGYMPIYGSGIAFGRYDTHTYLYTAYNDILAYIGGGSGNNLTWVRRICFTTGEGATGTWGINVTGNAATATKATQDGNGATISSTYLKLSGGTMAGHITMNGTNQIKSANTGSSYWKARDLALVRHTTHTASSSYSPIYSMKGLSGDFACGLIHYSSGESKIEWRYTTDATYNAGLNDGSDLLMQLDSVGSLRASAVYGAVWNDYAEYRETTTEIEPGRVVIENGNDTLSLCQERLMATAQVVSDTFGFAIGETDNCKTPLAVSGRVLVYTDMPRETFQAGDTVCSGINGTVSKMTREEIMMYPERIIGVVSAIPEYETWGTGNVKVNGRIWIKLT